MKNKELFTLNPEQVNLKNEGVAKIRTINEKEDLSIVEYELKTFVCEGEELFAGVIKGILLKDELDFSAVRMLSMKECVEKFWELFK